LTIEQNAPGVYEELPKEKVTPSQCAGNRTLPRALFVRVVGNGFESRSRYTYDYHESCWACEVMQSAFTEARKLRGSCPLQ
jgi:hypothetical protein